jgi:hypothetical protein
VGTELLPTEGALVSWEGFVEWVIIELALGVCIEAPRWRREERESFPVKEAAGQGQESSNLLWNEMRQKLNKHQKAF